MGCLAVPYLYWHQCFSGVCSWKKHSREYILLLVMFNNWQWGNLFLFARRSRDQDAQFWFFTKKFFESAVTRSWALSSHRFSVHEIYSEASCASFYNTLLALALCTCIHNMYLDSSCKYGNWITFSVSAHKTH